MLPDTMADVTDHSADQLTLLGAPVRRRAAPSGDLARTDPVARVVLDVGLPHLDRIFEYAVPAELGDDAVPGARIRVRFSGKEVGGFVVSRESVAEHDGSLHPIRRVVSAEAVLTPAILEVCRRVADRQGGVLADVLRLAVPPRHARTEAAVPPAGDVLPTPHVAVAPTAWAAYPAGSALLQRLSDGQPVGASWLARPCRPAAEDWPIAVAQLASAVLAAGRGVLVVVPDHRDVERIGAAFEQTIGADGFARLTADQGPSARYRSFLRVLRGHVRCVVGTRAAVYAPVRDLGLVVVWDDGDDLHAEPRAPYAHVRGVASVRAAVEGAALVLGGFTRSVAVQQWLSDGLVQAVDPALDRARVPQVELSGSELEIERHGAAAHAHLPALAWQVARAALEVGPVLVQVPRRGYLPSVQCARCREPARCMTCHGPLMLADADAAPRCRWCDRGVRQFRCPVCESTRLRAAVVGARRTAEELGRAFAGVPLIRSGAGQVVAHVSSTPALVVSTPGAEPVADGGYAAVLLLDAWAMLDRPTLDAGEQALRRWASAAALARDRAAGGRVVLAGAREQVHAVQALVRWAPGWFADRELTERAELRLPPSTFAMTVTGPRRAAQQIVAALPDWLDRMGSVRVPARPSEDPGEQVRVVLRCPRERRADAAHVIQQVRASRALHKEAGDVAVRADPDGATL